MPEITDYIDTRTELTTLQDDDLILVKRGNTLYKTEILQSILARLTRLEGGIPAPTPTPPPPPPPVAATFDDDFSLLATVPTGITVARTGSAGTYTDASGVIQTAAADTPRVQHVAGVPVGVYLERARTNLVPYGRFPGTGPGWTDVGTIIGTFTTAFGAAPDGDSDGTTRLVFAAENPSAPGYFTKRLQITTAGTADLHVIAYAKRRITDSQFGGMLGSWTTLTTSMARYEAIRPPAVNFNLDLAGSWTATDNEFWGLSVVEGGLAGESLIYTNGATVTRPMETLTKGNLTAGDYDVTVTFPDGTEQKFLSQTVVGTSWSLTADSLTVGQNIVKKWRFDPAGSSPVPAPAPVPTPAPAPAPGALWTTAMSQRAVATSDGFNEFVMENLAGRTDGYRGGSGLSFGRRWQNKDPKGWDWPEGNLSDDTYMEWIEPWFIMACREGSTGTGYIETCRWDFQVRYTGSTQWVRPAGGPVDTIRWSWNYGVANGNFVGNEDDTPRMAGLGGGISVAVQPGHAPHGGSSLGIFRVPNTHSATGVNQIENCMVSCWFRKDARSDPGWRGGMHISFDPKPTGTGDQSGLPYYINGITTKTCEATSTWQFLAAVPIQQVIRSGDPLTDRVVTPFNLYNAPPLYSSPPQT